MLTEQQKLAVETVDKNVLVSAGAGSGKTHVLVERYVEILRKNPEVGLGGIIAVTFTRKAAAEMRSRLKARFLALSNDRTERELGNGKLWTDCLREVDSARINTINSLCESILKTFPADSGIDPEFEMLDDLLAAEMRKNAVDHAIRSTINSAIDAGLAKCENTPAYDLLLEFPLGELTEILTKLLEQTIQFEEALTFFPEKNVDAMLDIGKSFLQRIKSEALVKFSHDRDNISAMHYIENNPPTDAKNALVPIQQGIVGYWQTVISAVSAKDDDQTFDRRWQAMAEICRFDLRSGGNKPDIKSLKEQLKIVRESAKALSGKIPAALDGKDARAMRCCIGMINLYELAKQHYKNAKDERNALDYGDQIALASAALRKPDSTARQFFKERTRALLIDEFQDTNDIQAKLLLLLAGDDTRIFLIGDDKQSIYKFQGADVSTFNRWKQRLSETNEPNQSNQSKATELRGDNLVSKLTMSFRSHPLVVFFVNALFAGLLDGDPTQLDYVAAFEALEPARAVPAHEQTGEDTVPATDIILFDEDDEGYPPAAKIEAAQVALWIKDKVDNKFLIEAKGGATRPIEYGDFAVLFNRNTDFAAFEEIFARVDIPFVSFGGTGFLLRQETADFENLLRFLDNPQNSHALLAVLRSPLCPLTDDLIHRVVTDSVGSDKNTPLWAKLTQANQRRIGGFESIMQAVRLLRTLLDYSSQLPLGELVQKTIELTRYDLTVLASGDGRQRSRNIWKIAQMARDNESLSCGDFADRLAAMREMRLKQGEAPLDSRNAVKLMTIHASKGLEFPAVALPCLGGQLTQPGRRFTYHKSFGCAFNTRRSKDDEAPTWYQITGQLTKDMEVEERKRLLYVAMTRARDCLGIFMRYTARRETDSYRKWLLEHLNLRQTKGFSLPEPGTKIVCNIRNGGHTAHFVVSHGTGMPPGLSLKAREAGVSALVDQELALAVDNIAAGNAALDFEEPALTVFETPPNELALLRLTPKINAQDNVDDFAYLAPRVVGTFFHSLMENLPLTKSVDREWVRDIAYNQGFHFVHPKRLDALVDEGMRLLDKYRESKLAPLVETSHSRFNEMPYLIQDDFDDPDNPDVVTMRPDMLIEAADGQWHLIDFKTDHFNLERIEHQAQKHTRQLKRYVEDLQVMGNVSIKPSLYFAQHGILYPLL